MKTVLDRDGTSAEPAAHQATCPEHLLDCIEESAGGLTISGVLTAHPALARRTAQRWLQALVEKRLLRAFGAGRARRYLTGYWHGTGHCGRFARLMMSAMCRFQQTRATFLRICRWRASNAHLFVMTRTLSSTTDRGRRSYLSSSLRHQLRQMGHIETADVVGTTYSRDITNRLLIDLVLGRRASSKGTPTRDSTHTAADRGRCRQRASHGARHADDSQPQARHRAVARQS